MSIFFLACDIVEEGSDMIFLTHTRVLCVATGLVYPGFIQRELIYKTSY